jgi:uncharacterized membrane protein
MRYYRVVLGLTLASVGVLAVVVVVTRSLPVALVGMALGLLLAFLGDFWTFKNLSWDPFDEGPDADGSSA